MTFTFIVNPRAGRGRFRETGNALEQAAEHAGMEACFRYTCGMAHASELAATATTDVVVAVGGDGTIHEVVSGLMQRSEPVHLGLIPAGTGNDFAKMFALPKQLNDLLSVMAHTPPAPIDLGRITWDGGESAVFVNVAGVGIDAKVAAEAAHFKVLSGTVRYLAAVLRTLRSWETPRMRVNVFQGGRHLETIDEDLLLALVGNGACAAGGFYLTPDARIADGVLDACVVRAASAGRVLKLIPRILRGGHRAEPEVTLLPFDAMTVETAVPLPIQADGEIVTLAARRIRFEVLPGALSVVIPVKT